MSFVSGFNASATGGSVNTIAFTAQSLYGLAPAGGTTSTTSKSTVTDAATMTQLQTQWAADTADTTAVTAGTVTATYGKDALYEDAANQAFTVQHMALDGTATTTTYTALDATATRSPRAGRPTFGAAASYAVTTTVTTPNSQNLLVQGGLDLTNLSVTGGTQAKAGADARSTRRSPRSQNYAALIGATQDRMTAASNFNTSLTTNYANGVSGSSTPT